jgi:hypothetical protein
MAMEIIWHRRNTLAELRETPRGFGVEVDIRSAGRHLLIHHDAFEEGEPFEAWLDEYQHGTLILNVKEEGLEARLLGMLRARGIERFFFLDQSFPFLIKTARAGESRCAVRVSEYESLDTALALRGLVQWVWVDCFTRFPLGGDAARRLRDAGFKLCVVSPELQGRDAQLEIPALRAQLRALELEIDAVCTKAPALWL